MLELVVWVEPPHDALHAPCPRLAQPADQVENDVGLKKDLAVPICGKFSGQRKTEFCQAAFDLTGAQQGLTGELEIRVDRDGLAGRSVDAKL